MAVLCSPMLNSSLHPPNKNPKRIKSILAESLHLLNLKYHLFKDVVSQLVIDLLLGFVLLNLSLPVQ